MFQVTISREFKAPNDKSSKSWEMRLVKTRELEKIIFFIFFIDNGTVIIKEKKRKYLLKNKYP